MEDSNQPEYAFGGGERDTSSITRFDLSLHIASEEETASVEARSTVFMTILLSNDGSVLLGIELKRAEMRKEHRGA
jgi:hypothetical protein